MILVRQEIGDVLRDFRLQKGRTLRQVASKASVALGYLSEVERGQKEASSEILASVADALDVPISTTGIAGPESPDGQPVGTVHVGVVTPGAARTRELHLVGDRAAIRAQSVSAVLAFLLEMVEE